MVLIILIIFIICFLFWLNKPKALSGVILFFANIGSGKTTLISKIAVKEQRKIAKGKSKYNHIVSNAVITGVTYVEDIRKLLKLGAVQKTLILVDEGSIVYNNRKMNLTEIEITYFKLIRHYTSDLIVVSQSYDDLDITLRRLYTQIYLLIRLPFFTLVKPIIKKVGIDETTKQIIDEYKFRTFFSWRLFFRPIYFKYFNSWWIPQDIPIHDLNLYEKQPPYTKRSFKNRFLALHKKPKK